MLYLTVPSWSGSQTNSADLGCSIERLNIMSNWGHVDVWLRTVHVDWGEERRACEEHFKVDAKDGVKTIAKQGRRYSLIVSKSELKGAVSTSLGDQ